jgi:outer membrane protein assembly factor BamA
LDTTNSSFFPTCGFRAEATALLHRKAIGSDQNFFQLALSHRHFIGFGNNHVLALQALATLSAGTIPWQMIPKLGGMSMLRGYYEGRYRADHYVAVQAEYRFPIGWRFSGAIFAATGEVVSSLSGLASGPLRASGGGGLRFLLDKGEHINLRLDVAATDQGNADFYIAMMESF